MRCLGELLKAAEKAKGARGQLKGSTNGKGSGARSVKGPETAKTLAQLGLSSPAQDSLQERARVDAHHGREHDELGRRDFAPAALD